MNPRITLTVAWAGSGDCYLLVLPTAMSNIGNNHKHAVLLGGKGGRVMHKMNIKGLTVEYISVS